MFNFHLCYFPILIHLEDNTRKSFTFTTLRHNGVCILHPILIVVTIWILHLFDKSSIERNDKDYLSTSFVPGLQVQKVFL